MDFDQLAERAALFKPAMIICGGSAYPREWEYRRYVPTIWSMRVVLTAASVVVQPPLTHHLGDSALISIDVLFAVLCLTLLAGESGSVRSLTPTAPC